MKLKDIQPMSAGVKKFYFIYALATILYSLFLGYVVKVQHPFIDPANSVSEKKP